MRPAIPRVLSTGSLIAALSLAWAAPSHSGLVAYWPFDGCTTADASGNGNALATFGGPACVAGRFGQAWQLDGVGQWLNRNGSSSFQPGSRAWTVALWERSSGAAGYRVMLEWYRCGAVPGCSTPDAAAYILALNDGHPNWFVRDDAASSSTLTDTLLALADGQWHFIAATFNPASDSTKLYVDGALRSNEQIALGTFTAGSIPFELGRHFRTGWGQPDYYFPGALDEVRVFDEELGAASIAALYLANATTDVGAEPAGALAIRRTWPNPARSGRCVVSLTLPTDEPARLSLFDIGGRRVARFAVEVHGAGPHQVEMGGARALPPGVYRLRLEQGAQSRSAPVVVLD